MTTAPTMPESAKLPAAVVIAGAAICSPRRVQLSRRKGYKLPENTVNVARPGKWGNPFIVGKHGTRERCVELFRLLCGGYVCVSFDAECGDAQHRFMQHAKLHIADLRGKNLACWCRLDGKPCHADILLEAANANQRSRVGFASG